MSCMHLVAFAKRPKLKDELDGQLKQGYLSKVNQPTDWVNSMVMIEKKNGDVRICIDPKDLNMAIKREHFQIPTKEEILGELAGASISPRWMPQPASTISSWMTSRP